MPKFKFEIIEGRDCKAPTFEVDLRTLSAQDFVELYFCDIQ